MSNPAYPVQSIVGLWAVHAHNGFLDIYLSLGLIGLAMFLVSFLSNTVRAVILAIQSQQAANLIPLILIVFIFMFNLTESQLLIPKHIWFYYVLTTVRLGIDMSNRREEATQAL